jgi:ABC-type branched-subunit amino acid transport system ATPase component
VSAALAAHRLAAGYGGHPVVRGIDLEVDAGQVVALLGPNGVGKTTTVLALAGELAPLDGEVRIAGRASRAPLHRRARAGLALVPEERTVFAGLSTADNLRVSGCDAERALELFPELRPLLRRRAGLLSGGEQQMLTLARALARRPSILLVDELSLGLAPQVVARLLRTVRDAADEGVAVLLVEQHVRQALGIADHAYVMRRGSIVEHGTPEEIEPRLQAAYLHEGAPDHVTQPGEQAR